MGELIVTIQEENVEADSLFGSALDWLPPSPCLLLCPRLLEPMQPGLSHTQGGPQLMLSGLSPTLVGLLPMPRLCRKIGCGSRDFNLKFYEKHCQIEQNKEN